MAVDDSGVWQRIHDGEPEAIEVLVERYEPHLVNYVYRVTGDAAAAEELFEQAMVDEVGRVMTGAASENHKLEIFRLIRRLIRGWLDDPARDSAPPAPGDGPSARVFAALRELPLARREAVVLRLFHKFSDEELALLLETSSVQARYEVEVGLARLGEVLL